MRYLDKIICNGRLFTNKRCVCAKTGYFKLQATLRKKRDAKREKILRCTRLFNTICLTRLSFNQFGHLKSSRKGRLVSVNSVTSRAKGYLFQHKSLLLIILVFDRYPYYRFVRFSSLTLLVSRIFYRPSFS